MQAIYTGAEAVIYLASDKNNNKTIIKERIPKKYRINILDDSIRKFRTKREAKILQKCRDLELNTPKLISFDTVKMKIEQEYIEGVKVRDVISKNNFKKIIKEISKQIAKLHDNNIVHGDLTTSNIILKKIKSKNNNSLKAKKVNHLKNNNYSFCIYLIDFGLSQFSAKVEDKAVDLHLFKQALESKHNKIWENAYNEFLRNYSQFVSNSKEILARLEKVEQRGRNKLSNLKTSTSSTN